jgi:hypothetical protein
MDSDYKWNTNVMIESAEWLQVCLMFSQQGRLCLNNYSNVQFYKLRFSKFVLK